MISGYAEDGQLFIYENTPTVINIVGLHLEEIEKVCFRLIEMLSICNLNFRLNLLLLITALVDLVEVEGMRDITRVMKLR